MRLCVPGLFLPLQFNASFSDARTSRISAEDPDPSSVWSLTIVSQCACELQQPISNHVPASKKLEIKCTGKATKKVRYPMA